MCYYFKLNLANQAPRLPSQILTTSSLFYLCQQQYHSPHHSCLQFGYFQFLLLTQPGHTQNLPILSSVPLRFIPFFLSILPAFSGIHYILPWHIWHASLWPNIQPPMQSTQKGAVKVFLLAPHLNMWLPCLNTSPHTYTSVPTIFKTPYFHKVTIFLRSSGLKSFRIGLYMKIPPPNSSPKNPESLSKTPDF